MVDGEDGEKFEVSFEVPLKKTDIELNFNIDELESSYSGSCVVDGDDPADDGGDDGDGADDGDYGYEDALPWAYIKKSEPDLSNIRFKLVDQSGNLVQTQTTNENGKLKFEDVPYGKYKIIQENAPDQLEINKTELEVDIDLADEAESCKYNVEWYNTEKPEEPEPEEPAEPEDPEPEEPTEPEDPDTEEPTKPEEPTEQKEEAKKDKLPKTGSASGLSYYATGFMSLLSGVYLLIRRKFSR